MVNPPYKSLVVGDPYSFIRDEPFRLEDDSEISVGQLISHWFATNEPGRIFRVETIHPLKDGAVTYETTFIGFQIVRKNADGTLNVTIEETIPS